jgi:hypothetical protein
MNPIVTRSYFVGDGQRLFSEETKTGVGVIALKLAFSRIDELKAEFKTPEEICVFMRAEFGNWLVESMKYRGSYKSVVMVDRFQLHIVDGLPGAGKSYQCGRLFDTLVTEHEISRKPAVMFSLISEPFEVYEAVGFFEKSRAKDAYLMCYEMALVIDCFKRIHGCMATSVLLEEKGFQPTFKHVILIDGGPQRANAFYAWLVNKDIHGFDSICHLWSELFRNCTQCYLFVCPWNRRIDQLRMRAESYPCRAWEKDDWGTDEEKMKWLEMFMARNLGKMCLEGLAGVNLVTAEMTKESAVLEQLFEDVLRENVESFTSEVGWWRLALKMGNDARTRRECEIFLFNKSWANVPFAHRLQIIQGAFHSRFSVGGSSVVPSGDEHVSVTLTRLIATSLGLCENDLQVKIENMDRNMILFGSTGYCGSWVEFINKEVRDTLNSMSPS